MRRVLIAAVMLAAVGGSAFGYYRYTRKTAPPAINTARITRGSVVEAVGATGQVQAVTTVQVGTQVSGTILELNADFNTLVRKGQVLARLDPSLLQTQIEQARANLIRAEADLDRLRVTSDDAKVKLQRAQELSAKKLIAQTDLEAAQVTVRLAESQVRSQQAAVTQAQASLTQNEVNLQHTVIKAPIDGLVISRNVDVGQTVAASMSAPTLFLLAADLTKMQVIASLDESDVGRIRPGQVVRFRVDAYPNDEFTGSVTQVRLQPTTVQNVVTYATVIDVPNPELKLKPGMTATVNVEIARRDDVLRVPNSALRFRPTTEVFAALGQTPPPPAAGGAGGHRGAGGGAGVPDTRPIEPTSEAPKTTPAVSQTAGGAPQGRRGTPAAATAQTPTGPASQQSPIAPAQAGQPRRTEGRGAGGGDAGAGDADTAATPAGSGARGFGGGRGGGQGNFQGRLASLSPEEREQMIARMRARGGNPQNPEEPQNVASGRAATAAPRTVARATTIDALFGALPVVETNGQVWLAQEGKLNRVRVRLGVSDGQQTELIRVLDGTTFEEETEVVTSVTIATQRTPAVAGANAFPGLGQPQRGTFQGVFPGGGGNRGAGAGGGAR